jgi:hypothetical protein
VRSTSATSSDEGGRRSHSTSHHDPGNFESYFPIATGHTPTTGGPLTLLLIYIFNFFKIFSPFGACGLLAHPQRSM